jgi:hypothetical protein
MDDASVERIDDPDATGLKVYSDISLATRGWTSEDSGFDPALIVSYTIANGWSGAVAASGTEKAYLDATTDNAFVYLATSDLTPYAGIAPAYPRGVVRDIKTAGKTQTLILDLGSL